MFEYQTEKINAVGSSLMNGPLPLLIAGVVLFVILTVFLLKKASSSSKEATASSDVDAPPAPEEGYGRDLRALLLPAGEIRFDLFIAKNETERTEIIEHTRERLLNGMKAEAAKLVAKRQPLARDAYSIQEEAFKLLVAQATPADEEDPVSIYWELERAFEDGLRTASYQEVAEDLSGVYTQVKAERAAKKELEEGEVTTFWQGLPISKQLSILNAETRAQQKAAIYRFGGNPDLLDVMARLGLVEEAPIAATGWDRRYDNSGGGEGTYAFSDGGGGD